MIPIVIILVVLLAGAFYLRMQVRAERQAAEFDPGIAIIEFGRAYPQEAIRSLRATLDQQVIFLRLHDGKAGVMKFHGRHTACHLIEPGKVRVDLPSDPATMTLRFPDFHDLDGTYRFASSETAAEVALWLLGSFVPDVDRA